MFLSCGNNFNKYFSKLTREEVRTDSETRLRTGEEVRTDCETRLRTGEGTRTLAREEDAPLRLRIDETVGRGSHILTSRVGSDGKSFGWSGTGLVASVISWVVVGLVDDFRASKYGDGCSIVVVVF
jgi:hypothetical protein